MQGDLISSGLLKVQQKSFKPLSWVLALNVATFKENHEDAALRLP